MITKMKKLTFLVYYKEYEAFLNGVRDLGVVHVAEKQQGHRPDASGTLRHQPGRRKRMILVSVAYSRAKSVAGV